MFSVFDSHFTLGVFAVERRTNDWQKKPTPEASPASDVARCIVGQDGTRVRKTGGNDGVREGDGRGQLDQGDVVAEGATS